eukprot:5073958-Lingulodinium_polyedra.AAC.1
MHQGDLCRGGGPLVRLCIEEGSVQQGWCHVGHFGLGEKQELLCQARRSVSLKKDLMQEKLARLEGQFKELSDK